MFSLFAGPLENEMAPTTSLKKVEKERHWKIGMCCSENKFISHGWLWEGHSKNDLGLDGARVTSSWKQDCIRSNPTGAWEQCKVFSLCFYITGCVPVTLQGSWMAEILHELQWHTFAVYLLLVLRLPSQSAHCLHTVDVLYSFFIIVLLELPASKKKSTNGEVRHSERTVCLYLRYTPRRRLM